MKPHEYVKAKGIKSLKEISELSGVSRQTLQNWYVNKFRLFELVVLGCKKILEMNNRGKKMLKKIENLRPCSDGLKYYKSCSSTKEAWQKCDRGDWMLWFAQKIGVGHRKLTLAKALTAELVIHLMKDERSKKAVHIGKEYGYGRATKEELDEAAADAYSAVVDGQVACSNTVAYYATVDDANHDAVVAYAVADVVACFTAVAYYATVDDANHDAGHVAYVVADVVAAYVIAAYADTADADADYVVAIPDADADAARKQILLQSADICREILTGDIQE